MDQKPTFNVVEPFDGILLVQMNLAMRDLLRGFIFDGEEIDVDVYSLAEGLTEPRTWTRPMHQTGFLTDRFENVITIQLNPVMRRKLREVLSEAEWQYEPQLVALNRALASPERCYEIRRTKHLQKISAPQQPADRYMRAGA